MLDRESVLLVVILAVLTEAGSALILIAQDHTAVGVAAAVGTVLTAVGGAIARERSTPTAEPRNAEGIPLVPIKTATTVGPAVESEMGLGPVSEGGTFPTVGE